jgi:hypothetical protein
MSTSGIGAWSGSLINSFNVVNNPINPIPASPMPGALPAKAPGAPAALNGPLATPFAVPDSCLDGSGRAHIQVNYVYSWYQNYAHLKDSTVHQVDTTLSNTPYDMYLFNNSFINGPSNMSSVNVLGKVFPRAVSVSDPAKFKIRILNLSHGLSATPPAYNSQDNPLAGNGTVSLCYANSLPVNATTTSRIAPGMASDYIELPYGTYQFRVFDENSVLVPGHNDVHKGLNYGGNYSAKASPGDNYPSFQLVYTPIRTYLPGGIYTLVVFDDQYVDAGTGNTVSVLQPAYQVISDNKPPANTSYSNIQWANALPGATKLNLQIDEVSLPGPLDFGNSSGYASFSYGQHSLTLKDNSNNTLASQSFFLPAMANYTVWAYADAGNKPQLSFVSNEMDFTNNGAQPGSDFNFACRFVNFCPDAPFVTFTANNYGIYSNVPTDDANFLINGGPTVPVKVFENLPFAAPILDTAYLMPPNPIGLSDNSKYTFPAVAPDNGNGYLNHPFYPLYRINAFVSQAYPTVIVPGDPIPGLYPIDLPFLINPSIYPTNKPNSDAGVFTVALIGRIGAKDASQGIRLMCIKHVQ